MFKPLITGRAWGRHVWALAFLAALTLIFFWPVTLGVGYIPRGGGDLVSLLWPNYHYAAQALWAGRLPLWNPTAFAGAPFALDNQVSFFYPINLAACLLWPALPYAVMEGLVLFHTWLAGASMYGLLLALLAEDDSPSVWPALLAAVAYMFSDVFITHLGNLNLNAVSAWLPAAFAALYLALTRRSAGWALTAGLAVGLAVLAGHAQMTFIVGAGLAAYTVWEVARTARTAGWRPSAQAAGLALLAAVVAVGVGAVTLLPTLEMTPYTARVKLDYAQAASYSIPWEGLAGLFSPLALGRGAADFWGAWDRVELGYLGVAPLFLAGLAPFRGRRGLPVFLALLAGGALLVALGSHTPVHRWLYDFVPGFSGMRVPARFILLTDFALAVLAGCGLQALGTVSRRRLILWGLALAALALAGLGWGVSAAAAQAGRVWPASATAGLLITLGLLAAGLGLALWRRGPAAGLAVLLLAADLIGQGAWIEVDFEPPTRGLERSPAVDFVLQQPGPTRVDPASGVVASIASLYGFENITGVNHALVLAGYQTYVGAMGPRGSRLYNFLNAQWLLAAKDAPPAADPAIVPVFTDDPALDVYLNTNAQPRVQLIHAVQTVATGEAAFAAILDPAFDPAREVVLQTGAAGRQTWPADGPSNLYYLDYGAEYQRVAVTAPAPGYLVLSEVWYPGWRAWVDGRAAPVERANFAFRAVRVEAGDQVVELRFVPAWQYAGLALTAGTLAALAGAVVWKRRAGAAPR